MSENERREIQSMTFEEWRAQASETELREASEFRYHYPVEVRILEVSLTDFADIDIENMEEHPGWVVKTVCGCDAMAQEEFGVDEHVPDSWDETGKLDFDGLMKELGL